MIWTNFEIGRARQLVFPIGTLRIEAGAGEIFFLPKAIIAILQQQLWKAVRTVSVESRRDCAELMGEIAN